jgi:hypothetical protein
VGGKGVRLPLCENNYYHHCVRVPGKYVRGGRATSLGHICTSYDVVTAASLPGSANETQTALNTNTLRTCQRSHDREHGVCACGGYGCMLRRFSRCWAAHWRG